MWRRLWPFGHQRPSPEATAAVESAERSKAQAHNDRVRAAAVRALADQLAAEVKAHNTANRYDDFLRRVVQGRG
jgi:hypothetical protein